MMTLEEMKLAVCEKLPHKLTSSPCGYYWNNSIGQRLVNWPTEGLQVCHEAEKLLELTDWQTYMRLIGGGCCECQGWSAPYEAMTATYEQRLEALCRVWHPERF